jgi:UDP-N-acetylglucosamine 2-epimerase (non-hydrolysing)
MKHLVSEGLGQRSVVVGDVMVDALNFARGKVATHPPTMPPGWDPKGNYFFATIHRAENTDNLERLAYVMRKLAEYPIEVRLSVHPRLRERLTRFGIEVAGAIRACEPLSYFQTVSAMFNAQGVVTDSGGLQKEAVILGKPCITVRHESEWVESIDAGWNVLDPDLKVNPLDWCGKQRTALSESLYGDGQSASRILDEIGSVLNGVPE